MVVGRAEGVLRDGPPGRENDEIRNGHSRPHRLACQHGENGRILSSGKTNFFFENDETLMAADTHTMIELDGIDDHELWQVVLVRRVVAVPGHHVERAVVLHCAEQVTLELVDHLVVDTVHVFEPGRRSDKVSRIGQSVGA